MIRKKKIGRRVRTASSGPSLASGSGRVLRRGAVPITFYWYQSQGLGDSIK